MSKFQADRIFYLILDEMVITTFLADDSGLASFYRVLNDMNEMFGSILFSLMDEAPPQTINSNFAFPGHSSSTCIIIFVFLIRAQNVIGASHSGLPPLLPRIQRLDNLIRRPRNHQLQPLDIGVVKD